MSQAIPADNAHVMQDLDPGAPAAAGGPPPVKVATVVKKSLFGKRGRDETSPLTADKVTDKRPQEDIAGIDAIRASSLGNSCIPTRDPLLLQMTVGLANESDNEEESRPVMLSLSELTLNPNGSS